MSKRKIGSNALVAASWVLSLISLVYFAVAQLQERPLVPFWAQDLFSPGGFLYMANLCILQLLWLTYVSSSSDPSETIMVSCHLTINSLLYVAFVLLYANHIFAAAELAANLAFANICTFYLWYNMHGRFLRMPELSGPLVWAIMSFYWTDDSAVPVSHPLLRIGELCFLWAELWGVMFCAVNHQDYMMYLAGTLLSALIGRYHIVAQHHPKQWIPSIVLAVVFYGNSMVLTALRRESDSPSEVPSHFEKGNPSWNCVAKPRQLENDSLLQRAKHGGISPWMTGRRAVYGTC